MGECAQFICRYYVILYKGFMYLQILVSEGFSGTDTQGYWKTTATFFKFFWMSHVHYQTESQFSFTLSSYSVYSEKLKHFITITTFTSLPTTPSKSEISFIWVNRDFLLIHLNAHFSTLGSSSISAAFSIADISFVWKNSFFFFPQQQWFINSPHACAILHLCLLMPSTLCHHQHLELLQIFFLNSNTHILPGQFPLAKLF